MKPRDSKDYCVRVEKCGVSANPAPAQDEISGIKNRSLAWSNGALRCAERHAGRAIGDRFDDGERRLVAMANLHAGFDWTIRTSG